MRPDKLIIYKSPLSKRNQRFRWRYQYSNGKKGPRSEEGFSSYDYALDRAMSFISPLRIFDVVDETKKGKKNG